MSKSTFATWWGRAFAEALGAAAPVPVARGKAKARVAKLRGLDPKNGDALVEVSASSVLPYEVRISLQPIPDEVWEKATAALVGKAFFAAKLLASELPNEVDGQVFDDEPWADVYVTDYNPCVAQWPCDDLAVR